MGILRGSLTLGGAQEERTMVDLGKLAKKAKDLADKQGDKIAKGVDKATDLIDDKTKGKYKDKLSKVDDMAKKLDKSRQAPGDEDGPADAGPPEGGSS